MGLGIGCPGNMVCSVVGSWRVCAGVGWITAAEPSQAVLRETPCVLVQFA